MAPPSPPTLMHLSSSPVTVSSLVPISLLKSSSSFTSSSDHVHHRRFSSLGVAVSSSSFSFLLSQTQTHLPFSFLETSRSSKRTKTRKLCVSAVFERFTERAIKAVIFSQREAKAFGCDMVFTQHLLLGLIAEDNGNGFLGSGITVDQARHAVRSIWRHQIPAELDPNSGPAVQLPFSISTKRVLEAAVDYSRARGHNFIAPEHIAIGLFTSDDGSAARVLQSMSTFGALGSQRAPDEFGKEVNIGPRYPRSMSLTEIQASNNHQDPISLFKIEGVSSGDLRYHSSDDDNAGGRRFLSVSLPFLER